MKRSIVGLLFLICTSLAGAQVGSSSRLEQLEAALNRVRQEQQSVYQQFQMVQELRRSDMRAGYGGDVQNAPVVNLQSMPSVNYEENIRQQRERQERIDQNTRDMNSLYARYLQLEQERKALLDQIAQIANPAARP